ncbi:MAG: hypothetical protein AAGD14_11725 [Planctomycetota bacterium]
MEKLYGVVARVGIVLAILLPVAGFFNDWSAANKMESQWSEVFSGLPSGGREGKPTGALMQEAIGRARMEAAAEALRWSILLFAASAVLHIASRTPEQTG